MRMSREEAIDIIKSECYVFNPLNFDSSTRINTALDMAINALEKDIPKAPKQSDTPRYGMGYEFYDWYCPTCNKLLAHEVDMERQHIHHCKCGQRLYWGKVK
jgi:hypothetical protein